MSERFTLVSVTRNPGRQPWKTHGGGVCGVCGEKVRVYSVHVSGGSDGPILIAPCKHCDMIEPPGVD